MLRIGFVVSCLPLLLAGCPTLSSNVADDPNVVDPNIVGDTLTTDDQAKTDVASAFDGEWLLTGEDLDQPVCVTILYGEVVRNDAGCDGSDEEIYAGTSIIDSGQAAEIRWQYMLPGRGVFRHERLVLCRARDGLYLGTCTYVHAVRESGRTVDVTTIDEVSFARQE